MIHSPCLKPAPPGSAEPRIHVGKSPVMNCPACDAKAHTRSSLEIDPTYRQLYYRCSSIACGMTWVASLIFERVLSPSGVNSEFRQAKPVKEKAPGHEFGQMTIFEILPQAPAAPPS